MPHIRSLPGEVADASGSPLLRLHAALSLPELWRGLQGVARERLPSGSLTLEIGHESGMPRKTYRHAHPYTPREVRRSNPVWAWLQRRPGIPVCRLSDAVSAEQLRGSIFNERVMKREGWDKLLCVLSWKGRELQGGLNVHRAAGDADFTARDLRMAETLQPHFHVALTRVLAHEEGNFRGDHFASMLEDVPVGLLLLDWDFRPLWLNGEAAQACAVWNHGERRAASVRSRRAFRVPVPLAAACAELRTNAAGAGRSGPGQRVISDDPLGLHAQIALRAAGASPLLRPAFHIQVDYRRPRGDRNRPLSPGAVALLARLSAREREVAMRVREGLPTAAIAAELHRSPLTIKTQIASIFSKFQVSGRTRVAALLNR